MLTRTVLACLAVALPLVSSSALAVEDGDGTSQYFGHPMDSHPGLSPRIIGGVEVTPHVYPFQAALIIYKGSSVYFCGGTILTNQWILTAAHCVEMEPDYILVGLGEHDLTAVETTAVVMNATKYVAHNGWDSSTFQNDVALIRLPYNVTFTDYIQPVTIANGTDQYAGDNATLIGWGQTETESLSYVLKAVNTTVLSNDACASVSSLYQQVIRPMHICSSGAGTVGVCSGDSGGPLLVDGVQVGITSFGTTNCELGMPSVFTRITEFHSWILENARDGASGLDGLRLTAVVLIAFCFSYLIK